MDLARAPRRAPLTARKKGSGYENAHVKWRWHLLALASRFSRMLSFQIKDMEFTGHNKLSLLADCIPLPRGITPRGGEGQSVSRLQQAWLHEVISLREKQTDIQCCIQLSGSDNFGFSRCLPEEHISINYEIK
jgi:hypothetical protein